MCRVGQSAACPPSHSAYSDRMVGTALARLCPPYRATHYSPLSHRPIRPHVGGHVDAELDLADRLDDVVAEQLREAGVAPVAHVQAVGDHEILDRDRLPLVPVFHDSEARK